MIQRDSSVDLLKCFAMLTVVSGHIFQLFFDGVIGLKSLLFLKSFMMPLFFLISGLVAGITRDKTAMMGGAFIKKKIETLLIPFLFWSYIIYRYIDNPADSAPIMDIIERPDRGAWFLLSLFVIQIVCYPIIRYNNWISWLGVIGLVAGSQFLFQNYFYNSYVNFGCYLIGFLMVRYRLFLVNATVATASFLLFVVFEIVYPHPFVIATTLAIVLLYLFSSVNNDKVFTRYCLLIGKNTLAVYLIHFYLIWYNSFHHITINDYRVTPVILIVYVLAFIVGILCVHIAEVLSRFPILAFLLFGKRMIWHNPKE